MTWAIILQHLLPCHFPGSSGVRGSICPPHVRALHYILAIHEYVDKCYEIQTNWTFQLQLNQIYTEYRWTWFYHIRNGRFEYVRRQILHCCFFCLFLFSNVIFLQDKIMIIETFFIWTSYHKCRHLVLTLSNKD